ncbi:hypothetical protein [Polynucleobacter nymphae]|uniref:hypothetical protein n=1 Tax=Polynucleobacter nymphae TaxID=2081043 RepID=UPI001C0CCF49|nr:hypothetical protein [Polynucleobacter nymphae]MBU3608264.1 hypothetical protein [Polynucleobacter nymphae]
MLTNKLTGQALFKGGIKAVVLIVVTILLMACSPKLDWRTVQSPQEGYIALFPAKPDKIERKVSYQAQELLQTLEAAKIDEDIYSISSIYLSKQQADLLATLSEQLKDNLFRSAGVDQSTVLSSDGVYQTANHQRITTKDYFLEFKSTNTAQQAMRVRWITNPTAKGGIWLYQVSILHTGPAQSDIRTFFLAEDRANFFDEFHPN